ncbi:GATA transcription factor 12-like [Syzygium oleosum]|uniref:GATA transcription factor 12-like n=1 Tax=Syzygium oleosum TaxID=219896 RepID=UPI0024BA15E5|nr:GATA transcription factor 12-like [Syzygium oleosum]
MEAPEIKMEAPEFFQPGFCSPQFAPERRHSLDGKAAGGCGDPFTVDDLLDFSTTDDALGGGGGGGCGGGGGGGCGDGAFDNVTGSSTDSNVTAVDSCNSSFSGYDPNFADGMGGSCRGFAEGHFSSDLCVPYDDLAELEWLSNFAEESFSSEDLQKLQLISGMKARPEAAYETTREFQPEPNRGAPTIFHPDVSVPGKARSKRSRAAPGSWASRLLVLSQADPSPEDEVAAVGGGIGGLPGAPRPVAGKKTVRAAPKKKPPQQGGLDGPDGPGGEARKCLHCQTDKTPQWRTGPMGPKTLCNACGVRYKSGRLVPEYRPAASPTFMLTKHSNSHRKVLELRRQKELQRAQQLHQQQQQQFLQNHHHQNMVFDVSNGEDYLIHQHVGPDFRQLM